MIVYTANYGGMDHPIPTNQMTNDLAGMEFVYFTDAEKKDLGGWNVIVDKKKRGENPCMQAKWFKMHSHELFPDQVSMWMDANYSVLTPLNREFGCTTEASPLTVFKHYSPNVVREFATVSHRCPGYAADTQRQMEQYVREGFPLDSILYRGSVLVRHSEVSEFNQFWWDELQRQNHPRDQLSLPYAIWRTGVGITIFDDADSRVFKVNHHRPKPRTRDLPSG